MNLSAQAEIACFLASQSIDLSLSASRLEWSKITAISYCVENLTLVSLVLFILNEPKVFETIRNLKHFIFFKNVYKVAKVSTEADGSINED
jgi:hypothetical protein